MKVADPALDDDEKPLDPAVERVRRRLVRFVGINLALLFVALMAVVIAIVYRAQTLDTPPTLATMPPPGEMLTGEIVLPAGARVVSQSFAEGRIALTADLGTGRQAVFLYDIASRSVIARFDVKAP